MQSFACKGDVHFFSDALADGALVTIRTQIDNGEYGNPKWSSWNLRPVAAIEQHSQECAHQRDCRRENFEALPRAHWRLRGLLQVGDKPVAKPWNRFDKTSLRRLPQQRP